MQDHSFSAQKAITVIAGYRKICDELEAENQALRRLNIELAARLGGLDCLSPGSSADFASNDRRGASQSSTFAEALAA